MCNTSGGSNNDSGGRRSGSGNITTTSRDRAAVGTGVAVGTVVAWATAAEAAYAYYMALLPTFFIFIFGSIYMYIIMY